jgi:hypothetical protein
MQTPSRQSCDAQYHGPVTTEELLTINSSWPGTTIAGEPGIVSGILTMSGGPDGSRSLHLAIGEDGAPPEECDFVEFVLSAEQAHALAKGLL